MKDFAKYFQQQAVQSKASKRGQFIKYWQSLSSVPMLMEPIKKDHVSGSSKSEDGIRVTGSPRFIAAVMARLKDILLSENPHTQIEIKYTQSTQPKGNGEASYILSVKLREK